MELPRAEHGLTEPTPAMGEDLKILRQTYVAHKDPRSVAFNRHFNSVLVL